MDKEDTISIRCSQNVLLWTYFLKKTMFLKSSSLCPLNQRRGTYTTWAFFIGNVNIWSIRWMAKEVLISMTRPGLKI